VSRLTTRWPVVAAGLAAAGLLAVTIVRRRLVVVEVDGISMRPTYEPGDRVLVRRSRPGGVRRGQVVVIERPDQHGGWSRLPPLDGRLAGRHWYIKRVAAAPGDRVPAAVVDALGSRGAALVPDGKLVVLGDNPRSDDSRRWGYVPGERVLGVVVRQLSGSARHSQ
jgi:signal peptidase I